MGSAMTPTETTHNAGIDQLQKLHRRRMAIFGSIILIAGIAIGSASTVILMPRREPLKPDPDPAWFTLMMSKRLREVLDLTAEQNAEVEAILKTTFQRLDDIRKNAKVQIDDVVKLMDELIRAVLTEEQKATWQREFEKFKRLFREGWGRRSGRGGPRPDHRRGPGDPNREFRGPGGRPGDPNRPWRGFGPGDPNRPREGFRGGPGRFGPGDPNRPPGDFDREAMRQRYRRDDNPPPNEFPPMPPAEAITEGEKESE